MQFKFRAYDHAHNKMTYDPQHAIGFDGKLWYGNGYMSEYPMTVMQFIGMKDNNEVEIYAGDIITNGKYHYKIVFHRGMFCGERLDYSELSLLEDINYTAIWKVLGNAYENPELIEEK